MSGENLPRTGIDQQTKFTYNYWQLHWRKVSVMSSIRVHTKWEFHENLLPGDTCSNLKTVLQKIQVDRRKKCFSTHSNIQY